MGDDDHGRLSRSRDSLIDPLPLIVLLLKMSKISPHPSSGIGGEMSTIYAPSSSHRSKNREVPTQLVTLVRVR